MPWKMKSKSSATRARTVELEAGNYELTELYVLRQSPSEGAGQRHRCFHLFIGCLAPEYFRATFVDSKPAPKFFLGTESPDGTAGTDVSKIMLSQRAVTSTIVLPREYWHSVEKNLLAKPGQTNDWTIPLPNELLEAMREAIKAEKAPKEKPAAKDEAIKGNG